MYGVDWISRSSTIAKCWTFGGGLPCVAAAAERAALRLSPRDLVEDLLALARELHQHDRAVRLRIDVGARPGELQLVARHLRDRVVREVLRVVVLEEVEALAVALPGTLTSRQFRSPVAADDDRVRSGRVRTFQSFGTCLPRPPARCRLLRTISLASSSCSRRRRPRLDDRASSSKRYHCAGSPLSWPARVAGVDEQVVEGPARDRLTLRKPAAHRRAGEVGLEVVELEHRRLADQLRRGAPGRGRRRAG